MAYQIFKPSSSDKLITSDNDVFKVEEPVVLVNYDVFWYFNRTLKGYSSFRHTQLSGIDYSLESGVSYIKSNGETLASYRYPILPNNAITNIIGTSINVYATDQLTIALYQNTTENNRVDKSIYLTPVDIINGALREETSILKPSILLEIASLPLFNYVCINEFGRYYFVKNISSVRKNLWRIDLEVDVLMTYRTQIKAQTALIARQENTYNEDLVDDLKIVENDPQITVTEIANSFFKVTTDSSPANYICVTLMGGGDS